MASVNERCEGRKEMSGLYRDVDGSLAASAIRRIWRGSLLAPRSDGTVALGFEGSVEREKAMMGAGA